MSNLTPEIVYNQTKERYESLTFEQKQEEKKKITREIRNRELEKTDVYMNQFDRYSQSQIDELKVYRQQLRDFINNANWDDLDLVLELPSRPSFIQEKTIEIPKTKP